MKIRIIIPQNSIGLMNDARIFQNALKSLGEITINIITDKIDRNTDIQLFVSSVDTKLLKYSKRNCFMINHELIHNIEEDWHYYNQFELVLCRTQLALNIMIDLRKKYDYTYKIQYLQFSYQMIINLYQQSLNRNTSHTLNGSNLYNQEK